MEGLFGLMILRVSVCNPLDLIPDPEASQYASPHYMLKKAAHPMEGRKPKEKEGARVQYPFQSQASRDLISNQAPTLKGSPTFRQNHDLRSKPLTFLKNISDLNYSR